MSKKHVSVVGATGAVGRTMLSILDERDFPIESLRLFASARSAGNVVPTRWGDITIEDLTSADPEGTEIALFSAGGGRSKEFIPHFNKAGAVVVDNSSAFRMSEGVPLVVVGVNDHAAADHQGIIANPNCTTMTLMMGIGPLHKAAGLRAMSVTSFQSVSGSGMTGIVELSRQNEALGADIDSLSSGGWTDPGGHLYERPIGWNVLPMAGSITEEGYTDEEWKLVNETRKILEQSDIEVEPLCVRVPVLVGHGVAATAFFDRALSPDEATGLIEATPGATVWSDKTPTPLDSAGIDDVLVGRVRETLGTPGGISLWTVGDNLRKGAALNAVQIAELLLD